MGRVKIPSTTALARPFSFNTFLAAKRPRKKTQDGGHNAGFQGNQQRGPIQFF